VADSAAVLPAPLPTRQAGPSAPVHEVVATTHRREDKTLLNDTGDFANQQARGRKSCCL